MQAVLTSPDAITQEDKPISSRVDALNKIQQAGHFVAIISNKSKPRWFDQAFAGTNVEFHRAVGRQDGKIVKKLCQAHNLQPQDALVLCAKRDDIAMGKNSGAVIMGAAWSQDRQVASLGIHVANASELEHIVALSDGWRGGWWFQADAKNYKVRVLADLSSRNASHSQEQKEFGKNITDTVKGGSANLNPLLVVTARSLLSSGVGGWNKLMWGVYPGSSSANNDTEVLSDFTHRVRTTVSSVQLANRDEPLFIRHQPSAKRSLNSGGNRMDPTQQIETIHLNPFYKGKVMGRYVVVVDDCTTYGVSFGVAAAFLRAAGAASVFCVALGKFGDCLNEYDIQLDTDPFAPVKAGGYTKKRCGLFGTPDNTAQTVLRSLIP